MPQWMRLLPRSTAYGWQAQRWSHACACCARCAMSSTALTHGMRLAPRVAMTGVCAHACTRVAEELSRALVPSTTGPSDCLHGWLQQAEVAARALVHGHAGGASEEGGASMLPVDMSALQGALVALAEHLQVVVIGDTWCVASIMVAHRRARRCRCRHARWTCPRPLLRRNKKRRIGLHKSLCLLVHS